MQWHDRAFSELTTDELYDLLALRTRVFVVEQACAYLELDGLDRLARHLWAAHDGQVHAYLRILPAGARYAEPAIGRVVVAPEARGTGLARELMERGLAACGAAAVRISAQVHLDGFYARLGFARVGDPYDDHGIPHVEMLRPAAVRA